MNLMAEMRNFKEMARRMYEAGVTYDAMKGLIYDAVIEVEKERFGKKGV